MGHFDLILGKFWDSGYLGTFFLWVGGFVIWGRIFGSIIWDMGNLNVNVLRGFGKGTFGFGEYLEWVLRIYGKMVTGREGEFVEFLREYLERERGESGKFEWNGTGFLIECGLRGWDEDEVIGYVRKLRMRCAEEGLGVLDVGKPSRDMGNNVTSLLEV